ncbi:MAG: hybrid sensor histidine kinase/response regulator [Rhodoferax sp.]|nr:hybrid sensor histidine kinase/response regulator [Rhodoferax sp.]
MNKPYWLVPQDPAIEQALFILGYHNLKAHLVGHACLSCLVAAGTWFAASHTLVLLWLGWMLGLSGFFVIGILSFREPAAARVLPSEELVRWKRLNLWMVTLPGIGWGSIGLLLVPHAEVNNLVVMTSFAGAFAYSSVSNAYDLRGFLVSVTLATVVLLSQLHRAFETQAWVASGMCLLYFGVMTWVARNAHGTLLESIRLRLANETLARTNAETAARAEQANRDKSEFLAAASHDLRQPVHALLLLIEAYRQQVPAAANHPLVLNIATAGQSIGSLFNALMELSRLESGMEKPIPSRFDLADLLMLLASRLRPVAHRKSLPLRVRLCRACDHLLMHTDKLLFERIVSNLLSNAVRYTSQGGVLLALRNDHTTRGLRLEVWDTGMGIAPADQARIFDPYVQIANRERDRAQGLGLGLAIVRHASALLGLEISVRSRPGRGSCFQLRIPPALLEGAATPPTARLAPEPCVVSPKVWLKGRRLLLVDDDQMIQQAMGSLLGSWGIDVRCAAVGDATVLAHCTPDWQPDCVLCDFRLPGPLDGVAMLDLLQEHVPGMVGILQTGELAQTVQARAEEAGYLVLYKPVEAGILAATLASTLDRRAQERNA